MKTITLALTGASGMPYGIRLLEYLLHHGQHVQLVYSQAAQVVAQQEMSLMLPSRPQQAEQYFAKRWPDLNGRLNVYGRNDWFAPMASGSNPGDAMVICPCTMSTLAKVAHGISDDLLCRAADVMLKEKRQLIVAPREMPFSEIHLQNMLTLTRAGAVIMPPNPGFYYLPQSIDDLIDFVVARIVDHLGLPQQLVKPWGQE